MDAAVIGAWKGGGGCADIGNVLFSGGAGGASIRAGYVSHGPTHREDAGGGPPSGGTETGGVDAASEPGRDVDIPFPGGGDVRGGRAGCGDLCRPPSEYRCAIYCDKAHYGPVSGGGAAPGSSGIEAVVGTRGTRSRGDMGGGGSGNGLGGADGRGGGERYGGLRQKGYCNV